MEIRHYPSTIWSVTMQSIEPPRNVSPCIVVHVSFRHWRELHHHCYDPYSPFLDDHNALCRELVEDNFSGNLVFPLEPETLWFRMVVAEGVEEGLPDFVTAGAWNYLKGKLLRYLYENVDFDDDLGLGFEMEARLDISTIDVVGDDQFGEYPVNDDAHVDISTVDVVGDDHLGGCSFDDDWEGCSDEDFQRFEALVEEILD
uniref:Uncharacterized protein n=1 Tax=Opuntia streptacantha TaxID=393608 RepID=A0A7C8YMH4_OPUST